MTHLESTRYVVSFAPAAMVAAVMAMMGCSGRDDDQATSAPAGQVDSKITSQTEAVGSPTKPRSEPVVVIDTSMGAIKVELWLGETPGTVGNFLRYVDDGFYDGLIFHRVVPGFMIQGGRFTPDMAPRPGGKPIRNEAAAGLRNDRGTIAMARTPGPHTASSQFFINLVDNHMLDHRDNTARGYGYCAFGKVTEGMAVVDEIAKVKTKPVAPHQHVPVQPVVIKSIRRAD